MINRLATYLGKEKAHLIRSYVRWIVIAGILQGIALGLSIPLLRDLLTGDLIGAAWWLPALAIVGVVYWLVDYRGSKRGFDAAIELLTSLRCRIGDHVAALPLGWFVPANTGRLGYVLSMGVMHVLALPVHQITPLVRVVVPSATMLVVLTAVDWRLGLISAAAVLVIAVVYWLSGRTGRRDDEAIQAAISESSDRIVEFAHTQPVLRTLDRHGAGRRLVDSSLTEQAGNERHRIWRMMLPLLAGSVVMQLALLALIAGLLALATGTTDPSRLVLLVAALPVVNRLITPLGEVSGYAVGIRVGRGEMDTIDEILATEPLPETTSPQQPEGSEIVVDHVSFGYDPGRTVIDDVRFTVPENSLTAIVGPSGSGKTTLIGLLARFYDPAEGAVRIGGVDLRELTPETLHSLVAPVFQDSYLFSGTIEDNVRLARPDATAEDLDRVAAQGRLTEVLAELPEGWSTPVGEGGARLSSGQRQRVALARALLKDAPILLLDEATGSLDAANQRAITETITDLAHERTIVVIAHQLTTIAAADQILFLDEGHITERGTHDELLAAGRRYAEHWELLTAAKTWQLAPAGTQHG